MMKHNWEYKKLGDACNVIGGSTPKTDNPEFWDGQLNWFTPAEIDDKKYYSSSQRKITYEGVKAAGLTLMPKGTILLTSRAPIGKLGIATEECYCNQGFKCLVCKEGIFNEYLYYALQYFNNDIKDKGRGATFKEISKSVTESIILPFPPLEYQESIVKELDEINGMIEGRKEQIKLLDQLAQSLFYEMFGDPITNPKGWELERLYDIAPAQISSKEPIDHNGKYWLLNLDQIESNTGKIIEKQYFTIEEIGSSTIIFDSENVLYSKLRPYLNKVVSPDDIGFCTTELIPLKPTKNKVNRCYLVYLLRSKEFVDYINARTGGAKMPRVKMEYLRDFPTPVPPIQIQKEFASKIELIEEQKKDIETSIKELETLLAARMDYWFN